MLAQDHRKDGKDPEPVAAKAAYKAAEDRLIEDTLNKSVGIITTLNKTADAKLQSKITYQLVVVDEAAHALELGALLPWVSKPDTVVLAVFVGDHFQLPPTVMTKENDNEGQLQNPFVNAISVLILERLITNGFFVHRLNEILRAAEGLVDCMNSILYKSVIDGPGNKCRQKATDCSIFNNKVFGTPKFPYVFLDIDEVCLRTEQTHSKYNPHTVIVACNIITRMLDLQLHRQEDITILSPYKAQMSMYRRELHKKKSFNINLKTIDSMQGQESECVILDFTVSAVRDGGLGFLSDFRRMNVGLTRAMNHCIILGSHIPCSLSKDISITCPS